MSVWVSHSRSWLVQERGTLCTERQYKIAMNWGQSRRFWIPLQKSPIVFYKRLSWAEECSMYWEHLCSEQRGAQAQLTGLKLLWITVIIRLLKLRHTQRLPQFEIKHDRTWVFLIWIKKNFFAVAREGKTIFTKGSNNFWRRIFNFFTKYL